MTLKPTITPSKGANTVLSSSEWNTSVIQSDNYLQELVAGSNSDKIGGTALANPLTVGALSTTGNLSVGGSTTMFGLLASSGTFSSTLTVSGATTLTGGVSGPVAATGAVQSNSHPVVEGTAAATHVECIAGQSAGGVAAGAETTVTLTFARAYGSEPAYSIGDGTTSAGNVYNIAHRLVSISTTAITVAWKNTDAGAQTLSHLAIICAGV